MTVQEAIADLLQVKDKSRELKILVVSDVPKDGILPVSDIEIGLENEDCHDGVFYITAGTD